jgi:hypothetical protein
MSKDKAKVKRQKVKLNPFAFLLEKDCNTSNLLSRANKAMLGVAVKIRVLSKLR